MEALKAMAYIVAGFYALTWGMIGILYALVWLRFRLGGLGK
jgi:hypothetical protein